MLSIDLKGKVVLITGSTGDLGSAIARTLASCGADIGLHYNQNASMAGQLCEEITDSGRSAVTWQADVCDAKEVMAMRDGIVSALGEVDIIVNNAVIQFQPWQSVLEQPEKDYRSQFESTVLHNVNMAKAFVPHMIDQKWGRVIGINTECSMQYWENQSAYISGKRGMDGVLRVLATEVGRHNITVNQVAPGWIASEKRPNEDTPFQRAYKKGVPMKRRGIPQEVANAVAFFASDLASFTTGLYFPVNGGNVMPAI